MIVTEDNAPKENAIIAKSACGALEFLPIIRVTNLSRAMDMLKSRNIWCLGLDGEAKQAIDRIPHFARRALILGAEGKGLRQNTQRHADMLVKITISDKMESLNVSNACAVALYALMQQKG
jgi:23S rRNA (guanosine2251-2'-O)-methyltransferase